MLRDALAAIDGVAEGDSMFVDGPAWWVDGREIAHVHGDAVELRLTRVRIAAMRVELKADPHVELRRSGSDWITVHIDAGEAAIVRLAELAAAAHRPPPGVAAKPPPSGPELERRRRFH